MSTEPQPTDSPRTPPPLRARPQRRPRPRIPRPSTKTLLGFIPVLLLAMGPMIFWFGCRIEPRAGEIAVLTRKTGSNLPSGELIALAPGQKGIQLEVLAEGRYFRNPYIWDWELHPITDIPADKLGVMTRLYGKQAANGSILAEEGEKGIVPEVLRPGKYRINPYAYHVEQFDAINIRAGHVGVITSLVGSDILHTPGGAGHTNDFLVAEGAKGVIAKVYDPGTYYLNPYMYSLVEVNLQGQRFEMSGDDILSFLTEDGFTVKVEGTIEFAIKREEAAYLTHRVGDMDDIVKKIILPRARGFSRIEGSKHPAIDYIVGETRQLFQNDLETHLNERCEDWGVAIRSVLVRQISPPDEIAAINREREVAVQDSAKYQQQIEQAQSEAELAKQEMMAIQNKEKVSSDTERIKAIIVATQEQEVDVISADKDLEVAKVRLKTAEFEAAATLAKAAGQKDAIHATNVAEAEVLRSQAAALGNGTNLARYELYRKIAPNVDSILSNDAAGGLGTLFQSFLPESPKENGSKVSP